MQAAAHDPADAFLAAPKSLHRPMAVPAKRMVKYASQVVEAELQRIPRALLRGHSQELWSIVYMPQASVIAPAPQREPCEADSLQETGVRTAMACLWSVS